MDINLEEKRVSFGKEGFILWLRRSRLRTALFIPIVILALIAAAFAFVYTTDKSEIDGISVPKEKFVLCWSNYRSVEEVNNPLLRIKLDSTSDEIYLENDNAQIQYTAKVYPKNIKDVSVEWKSTNDVIAPIDSNGTVTAAVPGEAEIIASASYNGKTVDETAKLRVVKPVEGIYMPTTTIDIYNGGAGRMLTAAVSPADASNKKILWTSNNDKIAAVDENGYVTPVGTGMTEVYAVTEDGGFSGKCFVNVINYSVKVDSVIIQNEYKYDAYLKEGETLKVAAAVLPANAKDRTLKWMSTNSAVASVSQTGIVRAISEGETYINVASNNGKHDILKLTVQPGDRTDRLDLRRPSSGIATATAENGSVNYEYYDKTLDEMVDLQMSLSPPPKYNGGRETASRDMVSKQMDPTYYKDGAYKYQFLDLSTPNGVTADELNSYLEGKGVLAGHAEDFIDAANTYGISELYLVIHACLETGNGSSSLARGIEVNGTTVYNMFGIGAYDDSAVYSGSRRAYKEGWTSVGAAIRGGAEWINKYYINAEEGRQNTLYKMLFNPGNPGVHQYATDCEWATYQAVMLDKVFAMFPNSVKTYEVPVYSGMEPAIIDG